MTNKKLTKSLRMIALILVLMITSNAFAQNNVSKNQQVDVPIHLKVYYQSVAIGDVNLAINSLHYLVASDPVKYGNWQDTLAVLYLQGNAYQQAYLLSNALLSVRGYTDLRMEVKAICAKALQQPAEAINAYSALYNKTKKIGYGFEELQLQYSIRRLAETVVTGNSLLQNLTPTEKTTVDVIKADGKTTQQVSFKAAVCNVLGLAYLDLKDGTNAVSQFEMALKESPEFELAKNNLDLAKKLGNPVK